MTLGVKFNATLIGVFIVGFAAVALVVRHQLDEHARNASVETAGLMMESALSVRKYTSDQIRPLLLKELATEFHPQTVPAYSATEMFEALRKNYPEVTYKEATLNPSNPRDRATEWEADVVENFRNNPGTKQTVGERAAATGQSLYIARPIKVDSAACPSCHGDPKNLPPTVKAKYGDQQGVGWNMNEVVGAQIASVPTSVADDRASKEFGTFLGLLIAVFGGLLLVVNVMLNRMVIAPIKKMAAAADVVSTGDLSSPEIPAQGSDEMTTLASSFNRLTRSLRKAMEMIDRG